MKFYLIPSVCEGKVPFTEHQVKSLLADNAEEFIREYPVFSGEANLHRVALTEAYNALHGNLVVSTMFLGSDWGFDNSSDEAPYVFETMVFKVGHKGDVDYEGMYTMRSSTWESAEVCHREAVEKYNA